MNKVQRRFWGRGEKKQQSAWRTVGEAKERVGVKARHDGRRAGIGLAAHLQQVALQTGPSARRVLREAMQQSQDTV